MVLDEAQSIKNPDSLVSKSVTEYKAEFRLALSGTPVENSLMDLWSQFRYLVPGLLGNQKFFREQFIKPIQGGDSVVLKKLRRMIEPFFCRRLKKDVAQQLPSRTEVVLRSEMSGEQGDVYRSLKALASNEVKQKLEEGGTVFQILEILLRLRQSCCHTSLVPGAESTESGKLKVLMGKLQELIPAGHRVLVFSQWTSFLDVIESQLFEEGIKYSRLDGSTRVRGAVVDAFQESEEAMVLLMSIKAGGTGLNLTAADHVFIMDPWWNPAVEDQAADRAHRIGQENPVLIHKMVALDSIEEKILELQAAKRQIASSVLEGTANSGGVSKDELLGLLDH